MYCRALPCTFASSELKDAAALEQKLSLFISSSVRPMQCSKGVWMTHAPSVGAADPIHGGRKTLTGPVEQLLGGAVFDRSCHTWAALLTRTQVIISTEIPSKRLTGKL